MMINKEYLTKKMDLPGVPGVKAQNDDDDVDDEMDQYKKGFMEGYELGLADSANYNKKEEKKSSMWMVKSMLKKMLFPLKSVSVPAYSPLYREEKGVSIITVDGIIDKRISQEEKANGKVDVDDISNAIKMAANAPTTAVVMDFNSPGGGSIGIQECGDLIKELSNSKPVFAYVDKLGASAAYWLMSCTNGIYATPTAEVGSIGVVVKMVNMTENLKMNGIEVKFYTGGELKAMGSSDKEVSEKEDAFIQAAVEEQTVKFKTLVSDNRGGVADENMQGQLFSGEQALLINIVDELVPDLDTVIGKLTKE